MLQSRVLASVFVVVLLCVTRLDAQIVMTCETSFAPGETLFYPLRLPWETSLGDFGSPEGRFDPPCLRETL